MYLCKRGEKRQLGLTTLSPIDPLRARTANYSGVARLGIETLELKGKGMSVTEIARLYNVPPSHVGAWISRSAQKLRRDETFLTALQ